MNKLCPDCNIEKPLTEFYFNKNRNCYSRQCKKCHNKKTDKYASENRDILCRGSLKYYYRNKEECKRRTMSSRRKHREKYPEHHIFIRIKTKCKTRNIPFEIEESDIIIPEFCPVLGIKLNMSHGKPRDSSPSIDRINPKLGYVKGNIMIISNRANTVKSNGTAEEHEKIAKYIRDNTKN
jgi:hypothetical protein